MSKFTFSRQLFKQHPNKRHYNEVINDFKRVINGSRLTSDNVRDEAISFRHLKGPTSLLMYKDCTDDIWDYGNEDSGNPDNFFKVGRSGWSVYRTGDSDAENKSKLYYTAPPLESGLKVLDFTIEYWPYNAGPNTEITIAIQKKGTLAWTICEKFSKKCGILAGQSSAYDHPPYKPLNYFTNAVYHPCLALLSGTGGESNKHTGRSRTDRLHTGAVPHCVRINAQIGKTIDAGVGSAVDLVKTEDIQAYAMAIKHDTSMDKHPNLMDSGYTLWTSEVRDFTRFVSQCSRFDHLNLIMVARKF